MTLSSKSKLIPIPKRQLIAKWLQKRRILPFFIEKHYVKLIDIVAGDEPYFWIHYGKECVCCERGWHN